MYYLLSSARNAVRKFHAFLTTPIPFPQADVVKRPVEKKEKHIQIFVMRSFSHVLLGSGGREAHQVIEDLPFLREHVFHCICDSGRYRSKQSVAAMMHALGQNVCSLGSFVGLSPEWIKPFEGQIGSFDDVKKSIHSQLELQGKDHCKVGDWILQWKGADLLSREVESTLLRIAQSALSRWPENASFPLNVFAASHDVCGELSAGKEIPIFRPGEVVVYQIRSYKNSNRLYIDSAHYHERSRVKVPVSL